jgi:lipoprotein-anchoring transpeptidase ErfK/SrfK
MPGQTGTGVVWLAGVVVGAVAFGPNAAALDTPAHTKVLAESVATVAQAASPPALRPTAAVAPEATAPAQPKRVSKKPRAKAKPVADNKPAVPSRPLHVIVSLDQQTVTLFAGGAPVAQGPISSGTRANPTPMGVFSVLQKNRHHVSNLYGAPMPYMQRLTWSGVALHHGPLPGYPASHGCIRMTKDFSELLWKITHIGARVIVTRGEVAPVEIAHPALFVPKAAPADAPSAALPHAALPQAVRDAEARLVRTADASNRLPRAVVEDAAKPMVAAPIASALAPEQPTKLPIEAERQAAAPLPAIPTESSDAAPRGEPSEPQQEATAEAPPAAPHSDTPAALAADTAATPAEGPVQPAPTIDPAAIAAEAAARAREAKRRASPVSVFVSRREGKLYVRQGMEPLFDTAVTIADPERPIGTHVYTAMEAKDDGLRWTVVSIPSSYPRAEQPATPDDKRKRRNSRPLKAEPVDAGPPSNASEALDRIAMPPEAVERIAQIVKPGSSLIVSDNKLSGETGKTTDFIVETR